MALRAGQEVDAFCTRCKMDLLHRIVAVVGERPAKVECRTCHTVHVYRAPKSAAPARPATATGSAPRTAAPRRPAVVDHAPVVPPASARVHPYRMSEHYLAEQWIVHRTFGNGLVLRELGPDKIEVRFDGGVKTLVHKRPE